MGECILARTSKAEARKIQSIREQSSFSGTITYDVDPKGLYVISIGENEGYAFSAILDAGVLQQTLLTVPSYASSSISLTTLLSYANGVLTIKDQGNWTPECSVYRLL